MRCRRSSRRRAPGTRCRSAAGRRPAAASRGARTRPPIRRYESVMTSDCSSCVFSMALSLPAGDQSSLCHTPEVSGCEGFAARAQAKTCGNSVATWVNFSRAPAESPSAPLSGSFHTSQPSTRGSLAKAADDALHVGFEFRVVSGVGEAGATRILHPAGVVHAGNGRTLRPELWIRIPAGIEQHQQRLDAVFRGDGRGTGRCACETRRRPAATAGRAGTRAWCSCPCPSPSPAPCRSVPD